MGGHYRLGVHIGGTFTDVVLLSEETGAIETLKVLTTPEDVAQGFLQAIDQTLLVVRLHPSTIRHVVHGTTVATNAIIENEIARTALVVTRGFRDLLEIARQTRPDLYDLFCDKPPPPRGSGSVFRGDRATRRRRPGLDSSR